MTLTNLVARSFITLVLAVSPAALTGCAVDSSDSIQSEEQEVGAKSAGRFELFVGQDAQHYFHLLAKNGAKVLVSEGYAKRQGAEAGVKACQKNGVDANNYDLRQAKNGQYYFDLLGGNGEIIGTSELYVTKSNAVKAINAVVTVVKASVDLANAPTEKPAFASFKGLDGKFYFHLRAKNGEIVLQSQGYAKKSSADAGIASVDSNGQSESNFELREAVDGRQYFVLLANNGKVIGLSQMYASKQGAQRGIESIVKLLTEESLPQPE